MAHFSFLETETKALLLVESEYNPAANLKAETVFAQCNGRMGIRAAHEIPGLNRKAQTTLAGFYHQAGAGEPDELVNLPDLLAFRLAAGEVVLNLDDRSRLSGYQRSFNLSSGELVTRLEFRLHPQLSVHLELARFVSFAQKSLLCQRVRLQVVGSACPLTVQTGIDGQASNEGVSHLSGHQFRVRGQAMLLQAQCGPQALWIQTVLGLSEETERNLQRRDYVLSRRRIHCRLSLTAQPGQTYEFFKLSRFSLPGGLIEAEADWSASLAELQEPFASGYAALLEESTQALQVHLRASAIEIDGITLEEQALIDYARLQLLGMLPDQTAAYSIPAKGLTGEGYRGHVFWDTEIYLLPFFANLAPEAAKNLIRFRLHGLESARQKARQYGFQGALFCWEVTVDGQEKTPPFAQINIHTGKANPVWSARKEQHISADIAYAIQKAIAASGDWDFLFAEAFPILLETAEFWVSRASWNAARQRLEILDVIGPDEYTEHVDNNAYTNYLAYENVRAALDLIEKLPGRPQAERWSQLYPLEALAQSFRAFLEQIYLPAPGANRVLPQDDTFLEKPLLPGLDRYIDNPYKQAILLDYSRDEVVAHQVLKQADVVMLQALLPERFSPEVKKANLDYYEPKTIHDSSLSPSMHAIAYADVGDQGRAYQYFRKSLTIDVNDHLSDSTDGLHAASLGGVWLTLVRGFAGIDGTAEALQVEPNLPDHWQEMRFTYRYQGNGLEFSITKRTIRIRNTAPSAQPAQRSFWIKTGGRLHKFDGELVIDY
ncbi:MAG: hypothetical protein MUE67_04160 [Anaerolineales bacterium]|nr:hypothetical protein [Anaerolineales bacterium]